MSPTVTMDLEESQKIAAFLDGTLPATEREAVLAWILSDGDASELLGLLSAPEFSAANTTPLPFQVNGLFIGGFCEDYFLPISSQSVEIGPRSRRCRDRVLAVAGKAKQPCFRKQLDLLFSIGEGNNPLEIQIANDENSIGIKTSYRGNEGESVEIWEGGEMVRKSPCVDWNERPSYHLEPGTSVAIRPTSSSTGVEILISEIEFSTGIWRIASLVSCLEGNLREALRVCREKLQVEGGLARDSLTLCGWISALQPLTRSEASILKPAPLTRAESSESLDLRDAYQPVWSGILQCWPTAGNLANPWSDVCRIDTSFSETGIGLEDQVADLIRACIESATRGPIGSGAKRDSRPFLRRDLANGWAALDGVTHLIRREFEASFTSFTSVPPLESDPFGLLTGTALARHLMSAEADVGAGAEMEASTNRIWESLFGGD